MADVGITCGALLLAILLAREPAADDQPIELGESPRPTNHQETP